MNQRLRFDMVDPRDVPAAVAARRMGLSADAFTTALPELLNRGFPASDPTTGNYDLDAIDEWRKRRHNGASPVIAQAASRTEIQRRLAAI